MDSDQIKNEIKNEFIRNVLLNSEWEISSFHEDEYMMLTSPINNERIKNLFVKHCEYLQIDLFNSNFVELILFGNNYELEIKDVKILSELIHTFNLKIFNLQKIKDLALKSIEYYSSILKLNVKN